MVRIQGCGVGRLGEGHGGLDRCVNVGYMRTIYLCVRACVQSVHTVSL